MRSKSRGTQAGLTAAGVSAVAALLVAVVISPPWGLGTVLIGVSAAAFASAYAVAETS